MPCKQAQIPPAQGGAHEAHRAGVRGDRALAGRERQAQADGHAQAVPEEAGHPPGPAGEGLQRELLQRVQVHPGAQGGEVTQAEGRVRQAVVRARPGVRVRLGRGEAAHRRQAGDLHHGGVRPLPQRGAVGVPVPPPGQPCLHGVAPQLLPRHARGAAHHGVRQHEGGRHTEARRQEAHRDADAHGGFLRLHPPVLQRPRRLGERTCGAQRGLRARTGLHHTRGLRLHRGGTAVAGQDMRHPEHRERQHRHGRQAAGAPQGPGVHAPLPGRLRLLRPSAVRCGQAVHHIREGMPLLRARPSGRADGHRPALQREGARVRQRPQQGGRARAQLLLRFVDARHQPLHQHAAKKAGSDQGLCGASPDAAGDAGTLPRPLRRQRQGLPAPARVLQGERARLQRHPQRGEAHTNARGTPHQRRPDQGGAGDTGGHPAGLQREPDDGRLP